MTYNQDNVKKEVGRISNIIYKTTTGLQQSATGTIIVATREWIIFEIEDNGEMPIPYKRIKNIQ